MSDVKLLGNNEMVWNLATMLKAVNEYLAQHGGELTKGVEATNILWGSDASVPTFSIKLAEKKP